MLFLLLLVIHNSVFMPCFIWFCKRLIVLTYFSNVIYFNYKKINMSKKTLQQNQELLIKALSDRLSGEDFKRVCKVVELEHKITKYGND